MVHDVGLEPTTEVEGLVLYQLSQAGFHAKQTVNILKSVLTMTPCWSLTGKASLHFLYTPTSARGHTPYIQLSNTSLHY